MNNYFIKYKIRPLRLFYEDEQLGDGKKRRKNYVKIKGKKKNVTLKEYQNLGKVKKQKVNKIFDKGNFYNAINRSVAPFISGNNLRDLQLTSLLNSGNVTNSYYQNIKNLEKEIEPLKQEIKKDNNIINEQNQKIDEQEKSLYEQNQKIDEQEKSLYEQNQKINEQDQKLNEMIITLKKIEAKKTVEKKPVKPIKLNRKNLKPIEEEIKKKQQAEQKQLQEEKKIEVIDDNKLDKMKKDELKKLLTDNNIIYNKNSSSKELKDLYKDKILKKAEGIINKKNDNNINSGLSHQDINDILKPYKKELNFINVFTLDEAINFLKETSNTNFCIIINTLTNEKLKNYIGHFVALNIDYDQGVIEYYDPFGNKPGRYLDIAIRNYSSNNNKDDYFTFKINKIQQQSLTSENCGWFCIMFLIRRRINNVPFKFLTNHHLIKDNEKNIEKFKKKFDYI